MRFLAEKAISFSNFTFYSSYHRLFETLPTLWGIDNMENLCPLSLHFIAYCFKQGAVEFYPLNFATYSDDE